MTREMNKPDWHNKWVCKGECSCEECGADCEIDDDGNIHSISLDRIRVLNPDIADFFWATVERYRK